MQTTSTQFAHALDVAILNQHETTIWHGLPRPDAEETDPQVVSAPDHNRRHPHVRTSQNGNMHHRDPNEPSYLEAVADALCDAERILLIGHGQGRSNTSQAFLTYATSRRPDVAARVIGSITSGISAMDRAQVLDLARRWYASYIQRS